jgi:Na+-transporting NADH:ubiquinone oxidoreductase subunit NqrD
MELDGILKAWTIKARMKRAISMAMTMGSTYSLINFFFSTISSFLQNAVTVTVSGIRFGKIGIKDRNVGLMEYWNNG